MIQKLNDAHAELIKGCETLTVDRRYDDTNLYEKLWYMITEGDVRRKVL